MDNSFSGRMLKLFVGCNPDKGNELSILKGHLLLEEVITEIIKIYAKDNPVSINAKKLTFSQKVKFLWAFSSSEFDDYIWVALSRLNSMRNSMAHSFMPEAINSDVQDFCTLVLPHNKQWEGEVNNSDENNFMYSIASVYGILLEHYDKLRGARS